MDFEREDSLQQVRVVTTVMTKDTRASRVGASNHMGGERVQALAAGSLWYAAFAAVVHGFLSGSDRECGLYRPREYVGC